MNKLAFPNGGVSLEGDDFRFLTEGVAEAIKGLALAHQLGETFILSGVEFSIGLFSALQHTSGFAVIDGEVCKLDSLGAIAGVPSANYTYIEIEETYDPAGVETPELGGGTINTYLVRKGKMVHYAVPQAGKVLWNDLKRLNNKWVTLDTNWDEAATLSDPLKRTRFRLSNGGCLEMIFRLYNMPDVSGNNYPASGNNIATLPTWARPDRPHRFALYCGDMTDSLIATHDGFLLFDIKTNGDIDFIPRADDSSATQSINGGSVWTGFLRIPLITI